MTAPVTQTQPYAALESTRQSISPASFEPAEGAEPRPELNPQPTPAPAVSATPMPAQNVVSATPERTLKKTQFDWSTDTLVYRVIDNHNGQVISQSPDEALLRLRAYAKQMETQAQSAQPSAPSRGKML